MARVRVVIYKDKSDEVHEDFICEDHDSAGYRVADKVKQSIPDWLYLGDTAELQAQGEEL